jgi:hypothetical protein
MKVEAFRCWNDKTWDTEVIEIDMDVDDPEEWFPEHTENAEYLIQQHYQACTGIVLCGIYHIPEEEDDE